MNQKIIALSIVAVALSTSLFICLGEPKEVRQAKDKANAFKTDLSYSLRNAKTISIVEHPWIYDIPAENERYPDSPPDFEYMRINLTAEQMGQMIELIEKMPPDPKDEFSLCIFDPHHTIEITRHSDVTSFLRVCFGCGDTEWADSAGTAPKLFQGVLRSFIEPLGFQAFRDWADLAKQQEAHTSRAIQRR